MMYPSKEVGFSTTYLKPTSRKVCKHIRDYILYYMFYLNSTLFKPIDNTYVFELVGVGRDIYNSIFNTIIDELEEVGYISLDRIWNIVRDMANPSFSKNDTTYLVNES